MPETSEIIHFILYVIYELVRYTFKPSKKNIGWPKEGKHLIEKWMNLVRNSDKVNN